jgi:soluble lytic murein transglycosylase
LNKQNSPYICRIFSIVFFLFSLCINSCADTKAQNDFYKGLLLKNNTEKISETVRMFEKALSSSNEFVRQAAAEELANLMFAGTEISAKTVRRIRSEAVGWWAEAFRAVGGEPVKEKALEFLFSFEQNAAARLYVLRECEKKEKFFTDTELAAIEGHNYISTLRYNEALLSFRTFQEDGNWPQSLPPEFLKYPVLINDLGRAFQYTSSGTEGLYLFLQWENNLSDSPEMSGTPEDVRFRLLFLAARIARRNGLSQQAASLFEQALAFAPDTEQSDASIWYILDMSLAGTSDIFIEKLDKLIPLWHNNNYFNDVLERFLQTLVSRQDWKRIIRVFSIIRSTGAAVKAGYAWVIGRVIEGNYLINEEMILAAQAAGSESSAVIVSFFKRSAYTTLGDDVSSFLYYRSLSATVLGEPFLAFPSETEAAGASPALEFLLGFFSHNMGEYAYEYITRMEQDLSVDELRAVAHVLQQAGMYFESIKLAARYVNREGHKLNRLDFELLFPRAYTELVEKYAAQTGVLPEILFALIRTESAFQSDIVSHAGAVGLTQLIPETASEMADRIRRAGGPNYAANGIDLNNPEQNIHIGAYYLNYLTARFDDQLLSLLAYNGGMNRVRRWRAASSYPVDLFLETITINETRDYGRKVMSAAAVYKDLYYNEQ